MSKTEQDSIKRQINYYLAKNIDTLKNEFYGENGIWSRYHKFIDSFKIDDKKIEVKINNSWEELNLEKYCLGLKHTDPSHKDENNFGAFSWWVERYLEDLGRVGGTSAGIHGIYHPRNGNCYKNSKNKEIKEDDNTISNKFKIETYDCIKNKLALLTDNKTSKSNETSKGNDTPKDIECKPNAVVLNKIYYLFKMEMKREDDAATSDNSQNDEDKPNHLIPIFKIKDEILTMLDLKLKDASWEQKSAEVYKKFNGSLNQNVTDLLNKTAQNESEKILNDLKSNENRKDKEIPSLKEISINLFKSYCFGCFYWSTLENQGGLSKKIDELISRGDKNIILTGAPGTGKTFACQSYALEKVGNFISGISDISENSEMLNLNTVSEMLKTVAGCNQSSSLPSDYFIKTVQFHPGYDYSDFIEGLRPKKVDNSIIYDRKDGIFKEFCKKVVLFNQKVAEFNNKPENKVEIPLESSKFFFIIDEINRGEVSKIFGEAFSMIETDKRAPVDSKSEDVSNKVDTQYSSLIENKDDPFQHGFYIPENVYILATMNEIDRSLEAMDFAFRRRFSWLTVEVQDTLNEIIVNSVLDDCTYSVLSHMSEIEYSFNELNELIKNNLGSDYMLGGSYLTSLKNSSRTKGKTLKEELWNNHLEPIIKDYIKGTDGKIEAYKDKFVDSNNEDSKKDPLNEKQ